jgi:hypothetical protein
MKELKKSKKQKILERLQRANLAPELKDYLEKCEEVKQKIRWNRKSIEAILDFSVGIKKLEIPLKHVRTIEDDLRMARTFKNLHRQNHEFKKWLREEFERVKAA